MILKALFNILSYVKSYRILHGCMYVSERVSERIAEY